MVYNTAIGFLLCGAALLMIALDRQRTTKTARRLSYKGARRERVV
jgi:hypothetical protein